MNIRNPLANTNGKPKTIPVIIHNECRYCGQPIPYDKMEQGVTIILEKEYSDGRAQKDKYGVCARCLPTHLESELESSAQTAI